MWSDLLLLIRRSQLLKRVTGGQKGRILSPSTFHWKSQTEARQKGLPQTAMASVLQQKAALRKQINDVVNSLDTQEILRQSRIVTDKILRNDIYKKAKSVSIYLSFDKEVQTGDLLDDIFKSGKTCYIPRFRKGVTDMEMIKLDSLEDFQNMPVNKWNIKQPPDDEIRESVFDAGHLDLVLTPGLAFTRTGVRLGRGKGYYDKFLARCFDEFRVKPATVALAFQEQIVVEIPKTETDVIIDQVIYAES